MLFLTYKTKRFQILFIMCLVYYTPAKYSNGNDFPLWANVFGWFLSSCSILVIPGYALYYLLFTNKHLTFWQVGYDFSIAKEKYHFACYFKINYFVTYIKSGSSNCHS